MSEELIREFMDTSKRRRVGDLVISAPFADTPGGVCSVTVKTKNGVLSFPVVIRKGHYTCSDLVQGDFSRPIDIFRQLAAETYTNLLPRPTTIPSSPHHFSLTHVVEDICFTIGILKGAWWGASCITHHNVSQPL